MKKLKLFFAAFALLVGWSSANAYTVDDLTSAGWTQVTDASISNVGENYYVFVDAHSSNYVMSCDAGHYRPCYKTFANPLENPSFVWILDGSDKTFALKSYSTGAYFIQADGWNTSMTGATGSTTFAFSVAEGKYSLKANGRSDFVGHWNDDGAGVKSDGENIAANKQAKDADGFLLYSISRATYDAALIAARETAATGASEGSPYDATAWIQNADWSGDWGGWARSGSWGNQQWGQKTLESWNATNVIVKQELRGVPNGKYKVQADMISGNNDNKVAYVFGTGASKISSSAVSAVASAGDYTTMSNEVAGNTLTADNVVVTGNTIAIGIDQAKGWIVADNFKLFYLGEDLDIYVDAYNDAVAAANAVDQSAPMKATVLAALQSAITTYGTGVDTSDKDALLEATSALGTATDNANTSIAAYLNANNALTGMYNIISGTNFYTEEALSAYGYATNQAAYDARTMTNEVASALVNPEAITGWRAANTTDDLLMSVWDENPEAWGSYHVNTWSTEGESDGSNFKVPFIEYWTGDGDALGVKTMTATINGLEDGLYKVSAWVRVRAKNGTAATDATGITIDVNGGDKVDVTQGTQIGESQFQHATYEAQGLVVDGVLTFKFNVEDGNNISWLSYKNVKYIKIRDLEPSEYKDGLETAIGNATAIIDAKANVGSNVFQIPESAWSTLSGAKNTAQGVYDDGDATANEVKQAIEDLNAAIEAYGNVELNAPAVGTHYNLVVATDGHAKNGNAVIIVPGTPSANNPTGYGLNANFAINSNLAQAITFTKVSGNTYNISFETADGTAYLTYGALNGSAAGWKNAQIQATTNAENKGEFKIVATATADVFNIVNTLTDTNIDCQAGGNIYTDDNITLDGFSVAEASEATVSMAIENEVKYATRIFPFTPSTWPNGVVAYSCAASADGELTLKEENAPEANVPYILYAEGGSTGSISGWGTAAAASYTVGWLTGVYEDTKATAGTYVLQNNNEKVAFYVVEAEKEPTVGANRCYLSVPAQEGRSAYFFPGSGEVVTGINAAVKALTSGKAQIFNASGAQIPALQKGMNIILLEDGTTQKIVVQ